MKVEQGGGYCLSGLLERELLHWRVVKSCAATGRYHWQLISWRKGGLLRERMSDFSFALLESFWVALISR